MAVQNNRILRFFMVLIAVLLTIFIYASYYSNPVMTLPSRLHASGASSSSTSINNKIRYPFNSANNIDIFDKGMKLNSTSNFRTYANESGTASSVLSPSLIVNCTSANSRNSFSDSLFNGTLNIAVVPKVPGSASSVHAVVPLSYSKNRTVQIHNDPLKGIPTVDIYESGYDSMNSSICKDKGKGIKLLIIITSAPKNHDARLAIRQTWGHYSMRRDVAMAFSLGRTENQQIENGVSSENSLYSDLIRGNFIDSYNNLTLKTISILEWVDTVCPLASFVLKTDDDMFINVPKLLAFIEKRKTDKRSIYGRLAKKWKPIRNQKSKYYVSPAQFPSGVFPQFTTGPAYLMTSDIIKDLYHKALEQTYLKLEDVFTTGIVAQLLNIKRIHVNEFLNRRIAFNPCNIRKAISVHMIKSNEQFDLWKKLLDASAKCK